MKRTLGAVMLLILSATVVPSAYADSGCSDATITGKYGFNLSGFTVPGKPTKGHEVPWAATGILAFDEAGNVSASYAAVINGTSFKNQTTSGTYTVNSDCTGSLSFTSGDDAGGTFNLVIIGDGTEILALSTEKGSTATVDIKKLGN